MKKRSNRAKQGLPKLGLRRTTVRALTAVKGGVAWAGGGGTAWGAGAGGAVGIPTTTVSVVRTSQLPPFQC